MEEMNNFSDLYEKGNVLLKSALKKYEEGKYEEADKDRELANQYYDNAKSDNQNVELDITSLYGENRNFGIIYKVIVENIKKQRTIKNGKKFINETIKFIKNNPLLKEQLSLYDTLSTIDVEDIETYINEALSLIPSFDKKSVKEINENLIKMVRNFNIDELIEINDNDMNLYESIEYLMFNKKTLNNIIDYNKNVNVIKENIESRQSNKKESITVEDYDRNLNNIIENLNLSLNEDEMNLLKEINESDKKSLFNKYKQETLQFISEQISSTSDITEKIDWNNILTRVNMKQFNESKILEDVLSFINIKNIIEN